MKKFIIILALMATGMCASAQCDTLLIGQREPTYYYWDTNWWDHYALNHPVGTHLDWYTGGPGGTDFCKPEIARYCYTDSSLRVIGLAAGICINIHRSNDIVYLDIPDSVYFSAMDTDYLRLYETDSNGGMQLMAEAPWHPLTNQPRHYMCTSIDRDDPRPIVYWSPHPIYEVFFGNTITVYDSFYVAITGNNHYYHIGATAAGFATSGTFSTRPKVSEGDTNYTIDSCLPKPNHFKRKLHLLDSYNVDEMFEVTDTNWHTFHMTGYHPSNPDFKPKEWPGFVYLFPIIDTSSVLPPPECSVPTELTPVYVSNGTVTLTWSYSNADQWELSVCRDDCAPEDGSITTWNNTIATIENLDTAQWYSAWVRSVCTFGDSIYYSDWSDSIRFYIPGNGGDNPDRIETTADRYTYLMPNPASETVTVASSFRIGDVEVYTLDGRRILASRVDGISTTLDISSLPTGTYIVRITTNNGTAYKKLVVK